MSVDGELISAFGVHESSASLSSFGQTSELGAYAIVFGGHLSSLEDARFTRATSQLTNLAQWCGESTFSVEFGDEPYGPVAAHVSRPREFDVEIPGLGARVSLHGAIGAVTSADEVRLTFKPRVSVRSSQPQPLGWFDRVLGDFRDLVAVCTFSPVLLENLSLSQDPEDAPEFGVHRAVWLREVPALLAPHRMPVRLEDLLPDIENALARWYELASRARSAIDLFLSVVYGGIHLNVFAFLAMTQAAEAFHALTEGGQFESQEAWDRHRASILSALPPDLPPELESRIKGILSNGNQLSLRSRLESLFSRTDPLPRQVTADVGREVAEIVRLRNALTHSTKEAEEAMGWQRVNSCVRHLQTVLLARFYVHLGLSDRIVRERLGELYGSLRFLGQP